MATTILLARHGETDWNRDLRWQGHTDQPLNERGREQARTLAETLHAQPPTSVYSSDLSRARDTAHVVAATLGLPVQLDSRLREIDVGEWSGLTIAQAELLYPEGARRRREGGTGWLKGESYAAMTQRSLDAVRAIAAAHPGERVLVVTHGGPMRAISNAADGEPARRVRYGNCDVAELAIESGRIRRIHSSLSGGLHKQIQG